MFNTAEYDELKEKIDELNRLAWEVRVSDSGKAYEYSKEAVELSKKIGYKQGLADGLRVEGFGYIRTSHFDEASACLNQAKTIYEVTNDLRGLAAVYEYLGIIQRYKGNSATALEYIFKAIELSRQTGFTNNEVTNLYQAGVTYRSLANYEKALDYLYQSLYLARAVAFTLMEAYNLHVIGSIYFETGDYKQALEYYKQGLPIREEAGDKWGEAGSLDNIGFTYLKLQDYLQAIDYCQASLNITLNTGDKKGQGNALFHLAEAYKQKDDIGNAVKYSNESLFIRQSSGDKRGEVEILLFLAALENQNQKEIFSKLSLAVNIAADINAPDLESKTHFQLYEFYKQAEQFKEAITELEIFIKLEKELHKDAVNQKIVNYEVIHKAEEAKKEAEAVRHQNYELVKLNNEIEEQKKKLEEALAELKSTQAQLIHSAKMASLGELTAGIAHEIQNPLNFVNNFSEVNKEMIDEATEEIDKGNIDEVKNILSNIKDNSEKINHHGKRADAIVKGMLQHSRQTKGIKEPTDINALCDEYLRLSYHGLRAKDKSFNADYKTEFDAGIGKINIVPQDIGRVLLNLFNNAFYAVNEKSKSAGKEYKPLVTVRTISPSPLERGWGEVIISDNGNGIPQNITDKIFQPFFTTKPTGQGTGLGLSLAYDIVTKEHNGTIKVNSTEGEGSKFIIQLPDKIQ